MTYDRSWDEEVGRCKRRRLLYTPRFPTVLEACLPSLRSAKLRNSPSLSFKSGVVPRGLSKIAPMLRGLNRQDPVAASTP